MSQKTSVCFNTTSIYGYKCTPATEIDGSRLEPPRDGEGFLQKDLNVQDACFGAADLAILRWKLNSDIKRYIKWPWTGLV